MGQFSVVAETQRCYRGMQQRECVDPTLSSRWEPSAVEIASRGKSQLWVCLGIDFGDRWLIPLQLLPLCGGQSLGRLVESKLCEQHCSSERVTKPGGNRRGR